MIKASIKLTVIAVAFFAALTSFIYHFSTAEAQNPEISLLSRQTVWKPFAAAIVTQNESNLEILVVNNYTAELWNRAYLPITINSPDIKPMIFNLQYITESNSGNARFIAEIRNNITGEVLWSDGLNNTNGQISDQSFVLPDSILNIPVEFRLYIITDGPGEHLMNINKAAVSFFNVTQPVRVESP